MKRKTLMKGLILCLLLIALVITGRLDSNSKSRDDWKKISPFTAVEFEDEKIIAEFEGTSYELISIGGITSAELVDASKEHFGNKWQKRIREDIAQVLKVAGAGDSKRVDLELKTLDTGSVKTISNAEMTEENRSKIYRGS